MCGIVGFLSSQMDQKATEVLQKMTQCLAHRGPDQQSTWLNFSQGIALGHRRLSIIDLSDSGKQPMVSHSRRYTISFNGEIYNYLQIRKQLETEALPWQGYSDTEVMLAAIDKWGLEAAVKKFHGMFAFALWDHQRQNLYLIRDRFGEKPLYYGWTDDAFLFSSELKSFYHYPKFNQQINRQTLALYMRFGYIPDPHCIYRDCYSLSAGTILQVNLDNIDQKQAKIWPYWQLRDIVLNRSNNLFKGSEQEAILHLQTLLKDAICNQMLADVPLGAFLSGGIDSSLIVALMQAQSSSKIRTFSIGFPEKKYDEAPYAKAIADHLQTQHYELYVTADEMLQVISQLPQLYDEPFADSSQIPTFLLSKLTREQITVSLSGDGGDEIFGGYARYFWLPKIYRYFGHLPTPVTNVMAHLIQAFPVSSWDRYFLYMEKLTGKKILQQPGDKLYKLAQAIEQKSIEEMYMSTMTFWKRDKVVNAHYQLPAISNSMPFYDIRESFMYWDTLHYLTNDLLVKVDRAAMGVSLETRIPFLDHKVVEFSWMLPANMKFRDGGKWILRQILYKYLPKKLVDRPKQGFGVPLATWLRGPLRDWAEDLLNPQKINEQGFFNNRPIQKRWRQHLSERYNWHHDLWNVLMFQMWYNSKP